MPELRDTSNREVVILVRVDDMDALETEGQRVVRFNLSGEHADLDAAVAAALEQAPPVREWGAA